MQPDRQFQLELLRKLNAVYPRHISDQALDEALGDNYAFACYQAFYLYEHQLIELTAPKMDWQDDEPPMLLSARLTNKGVDFLANDGGLSAILGVVTVKLHDDTIQALLISKVESSNLPPEEKLTIVKKVRELRGEATKHLVTKIVDYGLSQGPNAMQWLADAFK